MSLDDVLGYSHDYGEVDKVGGVAGISANLEGDSTCRSLGTDSTLDTDGYGTKGAGAFVSNYGEVFVFSGNTDGIGVFSCGALSVDVLYELFVLLD